MKHHFADLLDRDGDYWTIIPNMERYSFTLNKRIENFEKASIVTIGKDQTHWRQIFELPNLEELTLHEPSKEQLDSIAELKNIKRLRISHARPKNIEFISALENLEECVFEYVSGFSDLSPINKLKKIKSLHFENLRRVSDFGGLIGLDSLRYLHIDGTLDWNQPIKDFRFLEGLTNLEVLGLGFVINKSEFPAFLPILKLKKLKRVKIGISTFPTIEYAFLQMALPNVICGTHGTDFWEPCTNLGGQIVFLGKRAGQIAADSPNQKMKCNEFMKKYDDLLIKVRNIIEENKVANKA